jgi:hypothetical protein
MRLDLILISCYVIQNMQPIGSAMYLIDKDYHDSGRHCNLELAKDKWLTPMWGWTVAKKSSYTEALKMG